MSKVPLSTASKYVGSDWISRITASSNATRCLDTLDNPMKSFMAVVANLPKFKASFAKAAVTRIIPGPDIKFPIPAKSPFPTVLPKPSIAPPSPKDSMVEFTVPKIFFIAGSSVPPPNEAPAWVKLANVLLTRASKVWFNCSFLW